MATEKQNTITDKMSFWFVVGTFLVSGTYALLEIELQGFPEDAAIWPRILAVFIVIGSFIILFSDYLPSQLAILLKDENVVGGESHIPDEEKEAEEETEDQEEPQDARLFGGAFFAVISSTGYIVLGYLIGLLWATPVFTFVYMWNARVSYRYNVLLTLAAFLIAYGFYEIVFLPIDGGILFNEGLLSLVMSQ